MKKVLTLLGMVWALALSPAALGQPVVKYQHTDALGSVVVVTDANRNVVERREYEPYGAQLTPAVQDGPGYTGHVQDATTGLVYMQQRYYDPMLGRFLSVDPVAACDNGDMRHFNRYSYAYNNPYKFSDPDGREPEWWKMLVGKASDTHGAERSMNSGFTPRRVSSGRERISNPSGCRASCR